MKESDKVLGFVSAFVYVAGIAIGWILIHPLMKFINPWWFYISGGLCVGGSICYVLVNNPTKQDYMLIFIMGAFLIMVQNPNDSRLIDDFRNNEVEWIGELINVVLMGFVYRLAFIIANRGENINIKNPNNLMLCLVFSLSVLLLCIYWLITTFQLKWIDVNIHEYAVMESNPMAVFVKMFVLVMSVSLSLIPSIYMILDDGEVYYSFALTVLIPWHSCLVSLIVYLPRLLFEDVSFMKMYIKECEIKFMSHEMRCYDGHPNCVYNETTNEVIANCCDYDQLTVAHLVVTAMFVYAMIGVVEVGLAYVIETRLIGPIITKRRIKKDVIENPYNP